MNSLRLTLLAGIAALAAALLLATPSSAAVTCTKYASLSGNDLNDGSVTTPYLTIQHLVDSLNDGDTGCVRAGTYSGFSANSTGESRVDFNHGGRQGFPITLTTAPGDARATLRLRLQISTGSDYVTVSGLNLDGEDNTQKNPNPIVDGNFALITGNDITNHGTSADINPSTGVAYGNICVSVAGDDDTIQYNTIHDCGNKADPDLVGGSRNHHHGIYVTGGARAQIVGNWIYDNAARGIQFYPDADGNTVTGNTIDGNAEGIVFSGDDKYDSQGNVIARWSSDNNLVARNVISNSELRYNVYGNWPDLVGTGNVARDNCVYPNPSLAGTKFEANGGIATDQYDGQGFTAYNNKIANPSYVDRAGKNFSLSSTSPCKNITNPWWENQDSVGQLQASPVIASMQAGRLDVFAQGSSGGLFHKWYSSGAWRGPETLAGPTGGLTSAPSAVAWCEGSTTNGCPDNRLDIFARGSSNELEHKIWANSAWSPWWNMGYTLTSAPAVSSRGVGKVDVFWRTTGDVLRHLWWDGTQWNGPESLSGSSEMASGPAAVSWGPNRIDVIWRAYDNSIHTKSWNGTTWSAITEVGPASNFTTDARPAISSWGTNRLDAFARGSDGAMWHAWNGGSGWTGWGRIGGNLAPGTGPGAVSDSANNIDLVSLGTDNGLWHMWWDGSAWGPFPCPSQVACAG